jgi:hypothetical protein
MGVLKGGKIRSWSSFQIDKSFSGRLEMCVFYMEGRISVRVSWSWE